MKLAETVAFGGSGLARQAELRRDPKALARLVAEPTSRSVVFWNGKPLIAGKERPRMVRVAIDAPITSHADEAPIFLGIEQDGPVFSHDVSGWEPADIPDTLGAFHDPSEQHVEGLPEDHRFVELRAVMGLLSPRDAELAATARALWQWHARHRFCSNCGAPTAVTMGGWQRDCAQCGHRHFPRTDPVVIMLVTSGNHLLLGRSHGWPEGMYSLLAGFVEPGETVEAAVRREVAEETGVEVGAVRYLASQPWPFPTSLMIGCHGTAGERRLVVDPVELDDAIWASREQVMRSLAGLEGGMKPPRKGSIARFLMHNWLADRLD